MRLLRETRRECCRTPTVDASRAGRKIAGVCAGVAEYFDLDVTLVRVVWLITAVMTGIGVLSYPVAWVIMPEEPAIVEVPSGYPATH